MPGSSPISVALATWFVPNLLTSAVLLRYVRATGSPVKSGVSNASTRTVPDESDGPKYFTHALIVP